VILLITQAVDNEFLRIFGRAGCLTSNKPFDVGSDPDPGFLTAMRGAIVRNFRPTAYISQWIIYIVSQKGAVELFQNFAKTLTGFLKFFTTGKIINFSAKLI